MSELHLQPDVSTTLKFLFYFKDHLGVFVATQTDAINLYYFFLSSLCFSSDNRRVHPSSRGDHGAGSKGRLQRRPNRQDPHPDQPGHRRTRGTDLTIGTFLL